MKIAKILAAAAAAVLLAPANAATAAPAEDGSVHKNIAGGNTTSVSAAPFAAQVSFDTAGTKVGYVGLSGSFPSSGTAARVYGWGYQSEGSGAMSYFLKSADVTVSGQGSDPSGGPTVSTRSQSGHTLNGDSGGPLIVNGKLAGVLSTSSILPAQNPADYTGYSNEHASVARNLSWITRVSGVPGS